MARKKGKGGKARAVSMSPSDQAVVRLARRHGMFVLVDGDSKGKTWTFYDSDDGCLLLTWRVRGSDAESVAAVRKAIYRHDGPAGAMTQQEEGTPRCGCPDRNRVAAKFMRTIFANGTTHVIEVCSRCRGRRRRGWVPHDEVAVPVEDLPVLWDRSEAGGVRGPR